MAIVRKSFPALAAQLPDESVKGGEYPEEGAYGYDNSQATNVLGIEWVSFEKSVVDTIKSLQDIGA